MQGVYEIPLQALKFCAAPVAEQAAVRLYGAACRADKGFAAADQVQAAGGKVLAGKGFAGHQPVAVCLVERKNARAARAGGDILFIKFKNRDKKRMKILETLIDAECDGFPADRAGHSADLAHMYYFRTGSEYTYKEHLTVHHRSDFYILVYTNCLICQAEGY